MEATLKVIIGISGPLEKLAHKALEVLGQRSAPGMATDASTGALMASQAMNRTIIGPKAPAPVPQPDEQSPAPAEQTPQTEAESEAKEPEPKQTQPEPQIKAAVPEEVHPEEVASAIPDDETMRTMMDIAISKWAGVGSENSKDPQILKYRKDVCKAFKEIARHLGAEKPTKLQGDLRNKFLHEIENNLYCESGEVKWQAF